MSFQFTPTLLTLTVLVVTVFIFGVSEAKADWKWDALQITCAKDLNYFSLRTISFEDVKPKDTKAEKRIKQQSGIFDALSLLRHPYTCDLPDYTVEQGNKFPARTVTVELSDFSPASGHGTCGGGDAFTVSIKVNTAKVASYRVNGCIGSNAHLFELDTFNHPKEFILSEGSKGSE